MIIQSTSNADSRHGYKRHYYMQNIGGDPLLQDGARTVAKAFHQTLVTQNKQTKQTKAFLASKQTSTTA